MFGLVLLFVYVFFCHFSILITLLREGELVFVLIVHCLLAMHTLICVSFSLPRGVGGLALASACGTSWTFLFAVFYLVPFHSLLEDYACNMVKYTLL